MADRPLILLLPAMMTDEQLYRPQMEALAERARFLTVISLEPSMAACAEKVLKQAPEGFAVIGTSFGASLALEITVRVPERVRGLCLIGCNPGPHGDPAYSRSFSERVGRGAFAAVIDEISRGLVDLSGLHGLSSAKAFQAMAFRLGPAAFMAQTEALVTRADLLPALVRIACPTLFLWGSEDGVVNVERSRQKAAAFPGAEQVMIAGSGHLPTLERPAETTAAIAAWIDRLPAEPSSAA